MTDDLPIWAKDFTPRQNAPKDPATPKYPCALATPLAELTAEQISLGVNKLAPLAIDSVEHILRNPSEYPNQAVAAAKEVLARTLGAVPDTVIQNNMQFIVKWQD